jgi:hypothetical protein
MANIIGFSHVYSNKLHPRWVPPAGEAMVAMVAIACWEPDALPARADLGHIVGRSQCRCLLRRYGSSSEPRQKHQNILKHLSCEHERRRPALAVETRKRRVHLSHIWALKSSLSAASLSVHQVRSQISNAAGGR